MIFQFVFLSAEEGEEGDEDSPLSYDKLIMPGENKIQGFLSRHIPPVSRREVETAFGRVK